jgi:type VII secretion integral membrane protein EccD
MEYTRVTVAGAHRKADLVMPDDEAVGQLLPEILDLLGEPSAGGSQVVLTTLVGRRIDPALTLDEQDIGHGTMLRVTRLDEAPQPPDVVEVTEAVGDAAAARPDRWQSRHAFAALTVLATLAGALAASAAIRAASIPGWALPTLVAAALVAAAALARRDRLGSALALAGTAVGAGAAWASFTAGDAGWGPFGPAIASLAIAWIAVAAVAGFGLRRRGAALGAALALALLGGVTAAAVTGAPVRAIAAMAAVVGAALLGFLPALALSASGLTGFDDRAIGGERLERAPVESSIAEAFSALGWAVAATAVPVSASAVLLALDGDAWALGLAGVVALVLTLRARLFPLGPQRLMLFAAAAVPAAVWLWTTPLLEDGVKSVIGALAAAALVAVGAFRPSEVTAARLRRVAGTVELLCILASIPLLLGALGVYGDLLGAFS